MTRFVEAFAGQGTSVIYVDENGHHVLYSQGDRTWRNNNPGNLVYRGQPRSIPNGRFAKFFTYIDGYNALKNLLINACTGKSNVYKPTMTLLQFYQIYSPSNDGNSPIDYATHVANDLGVSVDTIIKNLL